MNKLIQHTDCKFMVKTKAHEIYSVSMKLMEIDKMCSLNTSIKKKGRNKIHLFFNLVHGHACAHKLALFESKQTVLSLSWTF